MDPEQIRKMQQMRLIQALYGNAGGAQQQEEPVNPMSSTQQSLLESINGLNSQLTQRQQQENALPQNAPIQQAQTNVNQQGAALIAQLLGKEAPFTANDHLFNENVGRRLGEAAGDAEVARARMAKYGPGNWQDAQKLKNAMAMMGENQAMVGNAPGQVQMQQNKDMFSQLGLANEQLKSLTPAQLNNPQLLAVLGKEVGGLAAQESASAGAAQAAQAKAQGDMKAAQLTAQGGLQMQHLKNQGDLAVEEAKQRTAEGGPGLSKSTITKMQESISNNANTLAGLNTLAEKFDPTFFDKPSQMFNSAYNAAESYGVELSPERRERVAKIATFQTIIRDTFNQYRRAITGAAASQQEIESLQKSIFNETNGPTEGKAKLLALMVKMETETVLAHKILEEGIRRGVHIEAGNDKFANLVSGRLSGEEGLVVRKAVEADIIAKYPQLAINPQQAAPAAAAPAAKAAPAAQSAAPISQEQATAQLVARGYKQNPTTGQWEKS